MAYLFRKKTFWYLNTSKSVAPFPMDWTASFIHIHSSGKTEMTVSITNKEIHLIMLSHK